jgi:diguanylate cyclase (GGDEF)-like protein
MNARRWIVVGTVLLLCAQAVAAQAADPAPQFVTVRLQRAAGVMALVPTALLWVLSRYRQKDYIRAWVAVWLCLAAPLFVVSVGSGEFSLDTTRDAGTGFAWGRLAATAATLIWLGGSAVLALSAEWIRGPMRWPRATWPITAAVIAAVSAAAVLTEASILPLVLWIAALVCLLVGAYRFLQLARRESFFGALLIGCALITVPTQAAVTQALAPLGIEVPDQVELWIFVYALVALGMHLLIFEEVTYELRRQNAALTAAQAQLKAKAVTDPLTGCYNRRFFDEVSGRELERHKRHAMPLSLLFVDCDRFKAINDDRGHDTGDRVLQLIASLLRERVRQSDYVFRWGGDEFLALLSCDEAAARAKAGEIQQAFADRINETVGELPLGRPVTLSIGALAVPSDAVNLERYISIVDERMYEQKNRDRVANGGVPEDRVLSDRVPSRGFHPERSRRSQHHGRSEQMH